MNVKLVIVALLALGLLWLAFDDRVWCAVSLGDGAAACGAVWWDDWGRQRSRSIGVDGAIRGD